MPENNVLVAIKTFFAIILLATFEDTTWATLFQDIIARNDFNTDHAFTFKLMMSPSTLNSRFMDIETLPGFAAMMSLSIERVASNDVLEIF